MGTSQPVLIPQDDGTWMVFLDWTVTVNGCQLTVPRGTKTDLASVPLILRGLPKFGPSQLGGAAPAVTHDVLYAARGKVEGITVPPTRFTRRAADRVFRQLMGRYRVGWFRRWVAWFGVRTGGWLPWPPSKTTWRNVVTRAGWTLVQASAAVGAYLLFGWPVWSVPVVAAGLSAVKTLTQSSMGDRVKGVIYR